MRLKTAGAGINKATEEQPSASLLQTHFDSTGARHLLWLGQLLSYEIDRPGKWSTTDAPMSASERKAVMEDALNDLKSYVREHPRSLIRKSLGVCCKYPFQDVELRMFALCAYGQLLGVEGHATFLEVLQAGTGKTRRPEILLEAKVTCSKLIGAGIMRLAEHNGLPMYAPLYLADSTAEHFVGIACHTMAAKTVAKGGPEMPKAATSSHPKELDQQEKECSQKVAAAEQADNRLRFCAYYVASNGLMQKPDPDQVKKLFSEFKLRLSRQGSWRSITHLHADIVGKYGVPPERIG